MKTDLLQVMLRSGTTERVCWVEPRVKIGDRLTLKNSEDPERLWDVVETGARLERDRINRGWNNNI